MGLQPGSRVRGSRRRFWLEAGGLWRIAIYKGVDISVKRVKLPFAGLEVEFVDREVGLRQFEAWAERGTRFPVVVFGPEGCGKSALLKQAVELLKERGYSVALVSPLARLIEDRLVLTEELRELGRDVLATTVGEAAAGLIDVAVELLYKAVRREIGKKIALLLDDVFQAVGLDKAALLVKSLLNMIEYPSVKYERIVVVAATSEGVTRREIGRHEWATLMPMWNMPREGFRQLYDQLPGEKPPFEEVWRLTGGNPRVLDRLYSAMWDAERVLDEIKERRNLTPSFTAKWRKWLECAVEDPDCLWSPEAPEELIRELVERNLIVYNMYGRKQYLWLDAPPPEKDPELGIGANAAWQTPLHREAVRRALIGY